MKFSGAALQGRAYHSGQGRGKAISVFRSSLGEILPSGAAIRHGAGVNKPQVNLSLPGRGKHSLKPLAWYFSAPACREGRLFVRTMARLAVVHLGRVSKTFPCVYLNFLTRPRQSRCRSWFHFFEFLFLSARSTLLMA